MLQVKVWIVLTTDIDIRGAGELAPSPIFLLRAKSCKYVHIFLVFSLIVCRSTFFQNRLSNNLRHYKTGNRPIFTIKVVINAWGKGLFEISMHIHNLIPSLSLNYSKILKVSLWTILSKNKGQQSKC